MTSYSSKERKQAKDDYETFFNENPNLKNPSDVNRKEKFDFAKRIGWERLSIMQACRKKKESFTKRKKSRRIHPIDARKLK